MIGCDLLHPRFEQWELRCGGFIVRELRYSLGYCAVIGYSRFSSGGGRDDGRGGRDDGRGGRDDGS